MWSTPASTPASTPTSTPVSTPKAAPAVPELQAKTDKTEVKAKDQSLTEKAAAVYDQLQAKASQTKEKATDKAIMIYKDVKAKSVHTKDKTVAILRNPEYQHCTVLIAGGAVAFGSVGGAFGCASGVVLGSAAGLVPALFTLGLSIPAGGVIGGVGGLFSGVLIGGSTGGVVGLASYKYRIQIKDGFMTVKVKAFDIKGKAKSQTLALCTSTHNRVHKVQVAVSEIAIKYANKVKENSLAAADITTTKASNTYAFATTTKVGVTVSSTAAGAVVGGTTIGAMGTVAGAAVGVVPAIFTFGLSIPVGAMIGMCAGTAIGGSVGAVSGGVAGYTGFTHGKAIKESVKGTLSAAGSKAETLKASAFTCVGDVKTSFSARVRACTGGSAQEKDD
jgi:hypothetical protein